MSSSNSSSLAGKVYTGENFSGKEFELKIGDYNAENDNKVTIIGVIANVEYPHEYKVGEKTVNFKDDSINSLIIYPYRKVIVYEKIDKGGRWIVFENSTSEEMKVSSLKSSTFSNKISGVEASKITDTTKKYQITKILDVEDKETFNAIEKHNYKMLLILLLCAICALCFLMSGSMGYSIRRKLDGVVDFYGE